MNAITALKSHSTSIPDHLADQYAEMEYAMLNTNLIAVTLSCDFCPNTFEIDAPADYTPAEDAEILCETCADEWSHFDLQGEDAYLDTYWESLYE